jgi:parvulin-like peptidyl-prolyl isomerase
VPTVAEQVYVHMFPLKDYATGIEARKKHLAGVDFSTLAREYSIDATLKQNGGELGWIPRGVFDPGFDQVAFELAVGEMSEPMYIDKQLVVVIMISDKAAARRIDAQPLKVLQSKALDLWLKEQRQYHKVKFRGLKNGYDTETDAWVQRQLQRRFHQSGEK